MKTNRLPDLRSAGLRPAVSQTSGLRGSDTQATPDSPANFPRSAPGRLQACDTAGQRPALHSMRSAFTMIEIAISLAVIGFALVAIIGVLPLGLNVQRDNRQETIINQDASMFMNAIKDGAQGLDDLTNYVLAITNYVQDWTARPGGYAPSGSIREYGYTRKVSTINGSPSSPQFPLLSGSRIIGLLSTPKILYAQNGRGFSSNHVVAFVRSISGPASELVPQNDPTVQQLALNYRMVAEVLGVDTNNWYDASWVTFNTNYLHTIAILQTNLHDLRLTFRWPLNPVGKAGDFRQIYRTTITGTLLPKNEPNFTGPNCNLYFFQQGAF